MNGTGDVGPFTTPLGLVAAPTHSSRRAILQEVRARMPGSPRKFRGRDPAKAVGARGGARQASRHAPVPRGSGLPGSPFNEES
jgi:hypothetical protein